MQTAVRATIAVVVLAVGLRHLSHVVWMLVGMLVPLVVVARLLVAKGHYVPPPPPVRPPPPIAARKDSGSRQPVFPESRLTSQQLDGFIDLILGEFVESWFALILLDPGFVDAIRLELQAMLREAAARLAKVQYPQLLVTKVLPIITHHFQSFVRAELVAALVGGDVVQMYGDLHPGVTVLPMDKDSTREKAYLRLKMAQILPQLLSSSETNPIVVLLVREILACTVLTSVVNVVSESDFFNLMVVKLVGSSIDTDLVLEHHHTLRHKPLVGSLQQASAMFITDAMDASQFDQILDEIAEIGLRQELRLILALVELQLKLAKSAQVLSRLRRIELLVHSKLQFLLAQVLANPRARAQFSEFLALTGRQGMLAEWESTGSTAELEPHYEMFKKSTLYKQLVEDGKPVPQDAGSRLSGIFSPPAELVVAAPNELNLSKEILNLAEQITKTNHQLEVLAPLIHKATLTANTSELAQLEATQGELEQDIRGMERQMQQYVVQESDNSLYGKSKVLIPLTVVEYDELGREYILYIVEVQKVTGDQVLAGWIVARRYSQFFKLNEYLKLRYKTVESLKFPSRGLFKFNQKQLVEARSVTLEKYLRQLLAVPQVCLDRVFRSFLSSETFTVQPGKVYDIGRDKPTFVQPICDFLILVFGLGESWVRGRALVVILQQMLGTTVEKMVTDQVAQMLQETPAIIRMVKDVVFPNGKFKEPPAIRLVYERRRTLNDARRAMAAAMATCLTVFGTSNADYAAAKVFAMMQHDPLNRHLVLLIADAVLGDMFCVHDE